MASTYPPRPGAGQVIGALAVDLDHQVDRPFLRLSIGRVAVEISLQRLERLLERAERWSDLIEFWRATLDTLSFLPLASTDPFGGVIITDWYSDPTTPNERFKATVYILDTRLRADALNVSIFRQQQVNGQWTDATVDSQTEVQIENAILTRARQLRLSSAGN